MSSTGQVNCRLITAKAFALAYVEHDLDLIDAQPESKYLTWEQSSYDKKVQEYVRVFRVEKDKVSNPVQSLLDEDRSYAAASMAEEQVEEYLSLRSEIIAQYVGTRIGEQSLIKIDALISLARLTHQRRVEILLFRHNEIDRQKVSQHRHSITYFNKEITAIIRQITAIQKNENRKNKGNRIELL